MPVLDSKPNQYLLYIGTSQNNEYISLALKLALAGQHNVFYTLSWWANMSKTQETWLTWFGRLVLQVLERIAAAVQLASPTAVASVIAPVLPRLRGILNHSPALDLPSLLAIMLQHCPWAAQGCVSVIQASMAGCPRQAASDLLSVIGRPAVVEALMELMCGPSEEAAEAAACLVGRLAQQVWQCLHAMVIEHASPAAWHPYMTVSPACYADVATSLARYACVDCLMALYVSGL
jgi:hypothetical protein